MAKLPSNNTIKKARELAEGTFPATCTIDTPTLTDDGMADVPTYALRDATTCRITKLGDSELTDQMRARNVEHFSVDFPAGTHVAVDERINTDWIPAVGGDTTEAIVLHVAESNQPVQTQQIQVTVIAYRVS